METRQRPLPSLFILAFHPGLPRWERICWWVDSRPHYLNGSRVWRPKTVMSIAKRHSAELVSVVASLGGMTLVSRATKFASTWTSQSGKPKQGRVSSGVFCLPDLRSPAQPLVESRSSHRDANPNNFQILPGSGQFATAFDSWSTKIRRASSHQNQISIKKFTRLRATSTINTNTVEQKLTKETKEYGTKHSPRAVRTVLAASSLPAILFTSFPSFPSVQKSFLPFRLNLAAKKFGVKVRSSSIDFDHSS